MATATELVYNDVTGGMASMHNYDIEEPTVYDVNVHDFEFNGSVTQWKGNIYQVVFYSCLIESKEE